MMNPDRELKKWRRKVDQADKVIIKSLGSRFSAVKKIGLVKQKWNLPVVQSGRWDDLMRNRRQLAKKLGVSVGLIEQIYRLIQKEAVRLQKTKRR